MKCAVFSHFHQQNFSFPATLSGTCRSVFPYKYRYNFSSNIGRKQITADTPFSSASLESVLTGIGLFASVPLGGIATIAGVVALSSAAMVVASKKSNARFLNNKKLSLAVAKRDKVEQMMHALKDKKVTDTEFNIILDELDRLLFV